MVTGRNFFNIPGYTEESGLAPPVKPAPSNAQKAKANKRGEVQGGLVGMLQSLLGSPPGMEQVQAGLGAVGDVAAPLAERAREDWNTTTGRIQNVGNKWLYDNPNYFDGPTETEGAGDPRNQAPTPEFIERMAQTQVSHLQEQITDLDELQEHVTPEGQALYDKFRAEKEQELADANNQLNTLLLQSQTQHQNFNSITQAAFPEGLIPGSDPEATRQLNELLDQAVEDGTGGKAPEIQAIIDSIVDSNLPESEKIERLGFVTDQAQMRGELQGAIDSVVTDREAIQELLNLPMAEVLNDPSLFAQPKLNVDVQFDPEGRTAVAVLEEVEGVLEQEFGAQIPPEVQAAFSDEEGSILNLVITGALDPNSEQFIQRVQTELPGVNPSLIQSAVSQGLQTAAIRHQAWDEALDQEQYRPGSIELIYALFKAAMGTGQFEPEVAAQIAESENIHHIIDVYSGGQVGAQGTGGRQGLGMLTPEAYERFGLPMDGTAESELMALVMYMMEPGNPAIRMQTFFDTGTWGN